MTTRHILEQLVAFDSVSRNPNIDLMNYLSGLLAEHGINATILPNEDGTKANLYATIGPQGNGGVMLSGHTDVVPIDGQHWTRPAFELTEADGRYYGRGTTDMKGFIACAMTAAINASKRTLKSPLHLAFSFDEEIGCVGVHSLIHMLEKHPAKAAMCIVGEPTSLTVATAHKGKTAIRATCIGKEGHSALAPHALNAIHLGCDLISVIRAKQQQLVERCADVDLSIIPYTTLHVGKINAGDALNIVPNRCVLDFEIRNVSTDNPQHLLTEIQDAAQEIVHSARSSAACADISFDIWNTYPGLNTPTDSEVVRFVKSLTGANGTTTVAFGTEGGLFSQKLASDRAPASRAIGAGIVVSEFSTDSRSGCNGFNWWSRCGYLATSRTCSDLSGAYIACGKYCT